MTQFSLFSGIVDDLVVPLQERLEEWKKTTAILDKKHAKGRTQDMHLILSGL